MRNAMILKARIKKLAAEKNISPQAMLQSVMFERFLKRVSLSNYRDKFILKGGMLIAAMIGLDNRTTMDLDATIRRFPFSEQSITAAILEICSIDAGDDTILKFVKLAAIREADEYGGFRIVLEAAYDTIRTPLKIDVTTGDAITPRAVVYKYHTVYDDTVLNIYAYNVETVLAEKFETIIRRGIVNTRARDFYDVYMILRTRGASVNPELLSKAIHATAKKRKTEQALLDAKATIAEIKSNKTMQGHWGKYCRDHTYAIGVSFDQVLQALSEIAEMLVVGSD